MTSHEPRDKAGHKNFCISVRPPRSNIRQTKKWHYECMWHLLQWKEKESKKKEKRKDLSGRRRILFSLSLTSFLFLRNRCHMHPQCNFSVYRGLGLTEKQLTEIFSFFFFLCSILIHGTYCSQHLTCITASSDAFLRSLSFLQWAVYFLGPNNRVSFCPSDPTVNSA